MKESHFKGLVLAKTFQEVKKYIDPVSSLLTRKPLIPSLGPKLGIRLDILIDKRTFIATQDD
ncbi:MAG TPA: hypothetical protein VFR94_04800 [Nitrososphaeraceae archaeon]|nr:hypothetical protein [Nitrososphaeraceae archaeon]